MYKFKLVNRRLNSKGVRSINSAVDLVGEEVILSDDMEAKKLEVDAVKVDSEGNADIDLSNGDQVALTQDEVTELINTGEVVESEPEVNSEVDETEEVVSEPKEFEVTRDVVDEDGEVSSIVTTKVDAMDESDAVEKVKLVDSRRKRNSRNYRINNSTTGWWDAQKDNFTGGPSEEDMKKKAEIQSKPESEWTEEEKVYMKEVWNYNCNSEVAEPEAPEAVEYKIIRNCGKMRKIASVTAPSLEEAMEAVKAKDAADGIQAEGYQELVEELPKVEVKINSDIEEAIVDDTVESPAEPEMEETEVEVKDEVAGDEVTLEDEMDRETNSFKGVAAFVRRAYGIDLK